MAKRRFKVGRRGSFRGFRRAARRSSKGGGKVQLLQPDAMIYGAARGYMSNLLLPLTSKIPLGGIADEVGIGLVDWLVAKNMGGMVKSVAMKGLVIENARLGEAIITGQIGLGGGGTATQGTFYG